MIPLGDNAAVCFYSSSCLQTVWSSKPNVVPLTGSLLGSSWRCHIGLSRYIICQMLHYRLTVAVCDVFLAGVGESLLSSDPGLTPRHYYFSVLAPRPKSCQHIFYPFARTIYFPLSPSFLVVSLVSWSPLPLETQNKALMGHYDLLRSLQDFICQILTFWCKNVC